MDFSKNNQTQTAGDNAVQTQIENQTNYSSPQVIIINNYTYNVLNPNEVNQGIDAIYEESTKKNKTNSLELLEKQVLLMLHSGKSTAKEIASVLNCSSQETKDILKKLRNQGLICNSLDNQGGHWQIIKKHNLKVDE